MAFRLSLRQKGLVLVCVPLLFEVAFVGLLSQQLQEAQIEAVKEAEGREIVSLTQNLADSMYRIGWNLASYVEKRDEKSASLFKQAMKDMKDRRVRLRELVKNSPVELEKLKRVEKVIVIAEKYCSRIETVMTGDERRGRRKYVLVSGADLALRLVGCASSSPPLVDQVDSLGRERASSERRRGSLFVCFFKDLQRDSADVR